MKLYARKCDISGKQIISTFSPNKPYKVYSQEIWFKGNRNGVECDYDEHTFIDSLKFLLEYTPVASKSVSNGENCEYTNYTVDCKNSYMSFDSV